MAGRAASFCEADAVVVIPAAEVDVDEPLVRRLLETQAPHLAHLPLTLAAHGWDNAIWRLGDDLAVRVTRRAAAAPLTSAVQRFLPRVAPRLPILVPLPLVAGAPSDLHPWPWSVVPWFDGDLASTHPPDSSQAMRLGAVLRALHVDADDDAPRSPWRGVPLVDRLPAMESWLGSVHAPDDGDLVAAAGAVVHEGVAAPRSDQRLWLHGDLHPRNIVVRDGRFVALLDWDDMCGGDPASDLAVAWWLFDVEHHAEFWSAYHPVDDATWVRSRAWAALFGLMFLHFTKADDPTVRDDAAAALGRRQLHRVLTPQSPPRPGVDGPRS